MIEFPFKSITASEFAAVNRSAISDGVVGSNSFKVTVDELQASAAKLTVSGGECWIAGYFWKTETATSFTIDNDSEMKYICIRCDTSSESGNLFSVVLSEEEPTYSAGIYEMLLATVSYHSGEIYITIKSPVILTSPETFAVKVSDDVSTALGIDIPPGTKRMIIDAYVPNSPNNAEHLLGISFNQKSIFTSHPYRARLESEASQCALRMELSKGSGWFPTVPQCFYKTSAGFQSAEIVTDLPNSIVTHEILPQNEINKIFLWFMDENADSDNIVFPQGSYLKVTCS